jgi:hypothetical protein
MIRETDLHLPKKGWGRFDLAASASRAGTAWTDHGTARQERGLKHRAEHETASTGRLMQPTSASPTPSALGSSVPWERSA